MDKKSSFFDSYVRQWKHPLMIPLHCLWAKSNNRTRGQFDCDVTYTIFSIVCLRFQIVQIKQVDSKMSNKNVSNYKKIFRLKLDVQGQGGGRVLDGDDQGGEILESWIIFMDVICVSSLTFHRSEIFPQSEISNRFEFTPGLM